MSKVTYCYNPSLERDLETADELIGFLNYIKELLPTKKHEIITKYLRRFAKMIQMQSVPFQNEIDNFEDSESESESEIELESDTIQVQNDVTNDLVKSDVNLQDDLISELDFSDVSKDDPDFDDEENEKIGEFMDRMDKKFEESYLASVCSEQIVV